MTNMGSDIWAKKTNPKISNSLRDTAGLEGTTEKAASNLAHISEMQLSAARRAGLSSSSREREPIFEQDYICN